MQDAALLGAYDADPFGVDVGELLLVVDALVETGESLLLVGAAFRGFYRCRRFFPGAVGAFALGEGDRGRLLPRCIDLCLQRRVLRGERRSGPFGVLLGAPLLQLCLV